MKYVWRAGYLECPESCDLSVEWADCQCSLNDEAVAGRNASEVTKRAMYVAHPVAGVHVVWEELSWRLLHGRP